MKPNETRTWWGRNWTWVVPIGCLGTMVLFAGAIWALVSFVFGVMKTSGAYQDAVAQAQSSAAVKQVLGEPIREGTFITGNIEVNGPSGHASLAIPLSGPKGRGTLFVEASKAAGQWTFSTLALEMKDTHERLDLQMKLEADDANPATR
jgi:hypothetical protein